MCRLSGPFTRKFTMPFYAKFVFTRTAEPASFSFLEQLRHLIPLGLSSPNNKKCFSIFSSSLRSRSSACTWPLARRPRPSRWSLSRLNPRLQFADEEPRNFVNNNGARGLAQILSYTLMSHMANGDATTQARLTITPKEPESQPTKG